MYINISIYPLPYIFKRKTEAQAIFLKPFTICSSCLSFVCLFTKKQTEVIRFQADKSDQMDLPVYESLSIGKKERKVTQERGNYKWQEPLPNIKQERVNAENGGMARARSRLSPLMCSAHINKDHLKTIMS